MISVRIDNLSPGGTGGPPRRVKLFEELGKREIKPHKIKEDRHMFFVILDERYMELLLNDETKKQMKNAGFEVFNPLEYNALKTVVVRQLDQIIDYYDDEYIKEDIERANGWTKVEMMLKLPTTSKMMKIRFATREMAQKAMKDGLFILNQSIPAYNIEKEVFIKLKPCVNCFSYEHNFKNCPEPKIVLCSRCSLEGHKYGSCTTREPKCINCRGSHPTLAAKCPTRKAIIKERSKAARERSRSRSRQTPSYAAAAAQNSQTGQRQTRSTTVPPPTNELITTIITSITYAHYVESIKPGTFQKTIDKMMTLNGLPKVKFPIDDLLTSTNETISNIITNVRQKQSQQQEEEVEEDLEQASGGMEFEREADTYGKRARDSVESGSYKISKTTTEYDTTPSAPPSSPEDDRRGNVNILKERYEYQSAPHTQNIAQQQQMEQPNQQRTQQQQTAQQQQQQTGAKQKQQRTSSLGRAPNLSVKEVDIKCYVKKNKEITQEMLDDPNNRGAKHWAREQVMQGEAKFTWAHQQVSRETVKKMFEQGHMRNLMDVTYIVKDDIDKIKTELERKPTQTKTWKK